MARPSVRFLRAAWHSAMTLPLPHPLWSALPGQAGCLLRNMKRSQEYLSQNSTGRPCHLHRLPAGLLTPQIYLLHLKSVSSARDLPGSPLAIDTHPLPVRAQLILWASAGHSSWSSTRQWVQHKMCSQSQVRGWRQRFNGERKGVNSHGAHS